MRTELEPFALPVCFRSGTTGGGLPIQLKRIIADAEDLVEGVKTYNRRRSAVASGHRRLVDEAVRILDELRRFSSWERILQPVPLLSPNLGRLVSAVELEFPPLPSVPADLPDRLKRRVAERSPAWWRRLLPLP